MNVDTRYIARYGIAMFARAVFLSLASAAIPTLASAQPAAETLSPHLPRICTGFNQSSNSWGGTANEFSRECGPNEAFMAIRMAGPDPQTRFKEKVWGNCCALPAADILIDRHVWVDEICPPETIVTGICETNLPASCQSGKFRCTSINTNRYSLDPEQTGVFWGFSSRSSFSWRERKRIKRSDIPVALRNGATKISQYMSAVWGCIGEPAGSLYAGSVGIRCVQSSFRTLRFKGLNGDSPEGTPVTMLPDCRRLSDEEDPGMQCIDEGVSAAPKPEN